MSEVKRYYWLKLKEDFFTQKEIKQLRKLAGGDTFTVIYLKMLLRSLRDDGKLYYEGVEDDFVSEVALDIDEEIENVKLTVAYLMAKGILVQVDPAEYELITAGEMTGSEGRSAERMRRMRLKDAPALPAQPAKAKTNAERQKAFRAKQNCEKRHIPFIEDYQNTKRYNGNYYMVMQRDRFQCAMCNSTENLCVHHIDGYDENKPENSEMNKMIVLCRSCHMQVHRSELQIPQELLDAIGYNSNDRNVTCDTEIDIEKKKEKRVRFIPPTAEQVNAYANEKGYSRKELDAEYFVDYYAQKGWMVGKGKMQDWKAAVRNWVRRYHEKHPDVAPEQTATPWWELDTDEMRRVQEEQLRKEREELFGKG